MQCFIVGAPSDEIRLALVAVLQELGSPPAGSLDLANLQIDSRFLQESGSLVVIPETGSTSLKITEVIDFARQQSGRAFVVWIADTIAAREYKQLVRTGSAEWITWRDYREELRELAARLDTANVPTRTATILSFLPSKGGVGNTTLLIEVAVHLSTRRKRGGSRVAILDLNLQGGTLADALDFTPRFDVAEIFDRPERLDEQLIEIFASQYSKSLDVFASPMRLGGLETIRPEIIFTFIDLLASRYDAILFDLPVQWFSWTDDLLRGSDAIIVSGGESVPALKRLVAVLRHLDGFGTPDKKVAAVVNPVETDVLGRVIRRGVIERALAGRHTFFVRRDTGNTTAALDVGRPLLELAPRTRAARDVRRLAQWLETITDR